MPPPGNFEILDSSRRIFLHFEVYFYFALLFLEVNQFEQIWRKKKLNIYSNRFPTNVGKNLYRSICLILTLEQNILITITSWQPLVFILSPSFLSISADDLHFDLKHLLPIGLIGLCFTFCASKGGIYSRMSFRLLLLWFPITQDLFLPKFLARIGS